jgi:NAD(P)-dependent dehydrogenase (short-subunit alcohol dehydrogenase family)
MMSVRNAVVLITGAARGMGRLYAQLAVADGAKAVVLWDADATLLAQTAAELGPTAHAYVVNLAVVSEIEAAAARVRAEIGDLDILINNAGIVRGKLFVDHDQSTDIALTMAINAAAPMHVTREFLPGMLAKSTESRIVNIASAAGLLSNPRMSVYSASKWAVVGWSDSLRLELRASRVTVTTVCPSYITTGMFEGVKGPRLTPLMKPEVVVAKVWRAMRVGKPMVMLPAMVHVSKLFRGVLPITAWDFVAGSIFRVYNSMDDFTGRQPVDAHRPGDTG